MRDLLKIEIDTQIEVLAILMAHRDRAVTECLAEIRKGGDTCLAWLEKQNARFAHWDASVKTCTARIASARNALATLASL